MHYDTSQYVDMGAHLSPLPEQQYRYWLWREWKGGTGTMAVVGLNPSTASSTTDDKTIQQCVVFAKREGFCRLVMVNLFAIRSTSPSILAVDYQKAIGEKNDAFLIRAAIESQKMVAAWGGDETMGRDHSVLRLLRPYHDIYCFGTTEKGAPKHPSRLAHDTPLRLFYRKIEAATPTLP